MKKKILRYCFATRTMADTLEIWLHREVCHPDRGTAYRYASKRDNEWFSI